MDIIERLKKDVEDLKNVLSLIRERGKSIDNIVVLDEENLKEAKPLLRKVMKNMIVKFDTIVDIDVIDFGGVIGIVLCIDVDEFMRKYGRYILTSNDIEQTYIKYMYKIGLIDNLESDIRFFSMYYQNDKPILCIHFNFS